jgi:predicted secreted protein
MQWTSIIAIYVLFWVLSAFVVMPFGVRNNDELGIENIPGQADGAPGNFRPGMVILRTTILAAILFGAYYANYVNQWVTISDIDIFNSGRWDS